MKNSHNFGYSYEEYMYFIMLLSKYKIIREFPVFVIVICFVLQGLKDSQQLPV